MGILWSMYPRSVAGSWVVVNVRSIAFQCRARWSLFRFDLISSINETYRLDSFAESHQTLIMKPTPSSGKPPCFGREIYLENHWLVRPNEDGKTGEGKCGVCNQPVPFYLNEAGKWVPGFHSYR